MTPLERDADDVIPPVAREPSSRERTWSGGPLVTNRGFCDTYWCSKNPRSDLDVDSGSSVPYRPHPTPSSFTRASMCSISRSPLLPTSGRPAPFVPAFRLSWRSPTGTPSKLR